MNDRTNPWEVGGVRRIGGVSAARLVAQALGVGWFVLAARMLSPSEFGVTAAGLTLVFVIGAISDVGLTRTITIRVGAVPDEAAATFARAAGLRLVVGAGVTAVTVGVSALVFEDLSWQIVVLAGAIATASGITEIGFSVMRALAQVRTEAMLLVGERLVFLVAGALILVAGGGARGVLLAYLGSNAMSAIVVASTISRLPSVEGVPAPLLGGDGRWIAFATMLTALAPRVLLLLVMTTGAEAAVGRLALAQKPAEALIAMSAAVVGPVLSMFSGAPSLDARRRASQFTGLGLAVIGAIAAWLIVGTDVALRVVFGPTATTAVGQGAAILTVAAAIALIRLPADATLLTTGRAHQGALVSAIAFGVPLAVLTVVGPDRGVVAAAVAVLVGEAIALVVMVIVSERFVRAETIGLAARFVAVLTPALALAWLGDTLAEDGPPVVRAIVGAVGAGLVGGAALLLLARLDEGATAGE